jgi:hypothetical protein
MPGPSEVGEDHPHRVRFHGRVYNRAKRWPEYRAVRVLAPEDVLQMIDKVEQEQYVQGMRCSDFKEALDAVRVVVRGV